MSYDSSTGLISAPVSISDVKSALGASSIYNQSLGYIDDLGKLCTHSNINFWSRVRPCKCLIGTSNKESFRLNQGTAADGGYALNSNADPFGSNTYGGSYTVNGSYILSPNGMKSLAITNSNINTSVPIEFPKADVYRLTDFEGYYSNAPIPIVADIASNGIIFVNNNELNFTVLQFDTQNITNKSKSLEIKRLFNSSTNGLGQYYLGFAFARASNTITCFRISTGKKLYDLFNNNVSSSMNENSSSYIAQSYVIGQGGIVYFGFNFKNVKDGLFSSYTISDGENFYVRPVILTSGSFISNQGGYANNIDNCYSFELYNGFANATRQIVTTYRSPYRVIVEWSNMSYTWNYISRYNPVPYSGSTDRITVPYGGANYVCLKYKINQRPYNHVASLGVSGVVSKIKMINTETGVTIKEYQSYSGTTRLTSLQIADTSTYPLMFFSNVDYANGTTLTSTQVSNTLVKVNSLSELKSLFNNSINDATQNNVYVGYSPSISGTVDFDYDYVYIYYQNRAEGSMKIVIKDLSSGQSNSIINGAGTY